MVQFKVLFAIVLALKIIGFQNPVLAQTNQNGKQIIVIDPGHGGKDSGAVGINGIQEKDVVLKIAKQIVDLNITVFENQHKIYLTRYKDTLISLKDRTKIVKALKADIFISIHCNHSDNPNARGVEVYASKKQGKYSRDSILLAYELQKELKNNLGFESRGVKFGDFQVLRDSSDNCSTILLEVDFLSQNEEAIYLYNMKSQFAITLVILESALIFFGL